MKNIVMKIMVTAVLFFSSLISMAQPSVPKNPNPTGERFNPANNPNDAPIDDAILFLLIAAVGLGIYMVARNYKKRAVKS